MIAVAYRMFIWIAILLLAVNQVIAMVFPLPHASCDYELKVQRERFVELKSPRWPENYMPDTVCRWIVDCPHGYVCRLQCHDMFVPNTLECSGDKILVSPVGSNWLIGADSYCGPKIIDILSTNYRITIGLIAGFGSPGGKFRCQVSPAIAPRIIQF